VRAEDCRRSSSSELATLALAGEALAWDEIVRRYSRRVRLVLLAQGILWDVAEDLIQETWIRLVRQQREGRLRSLELPGLAIAQSEWLAREALRTHARRRAIVSMVALPSSESAEIAGAMPEDDPAALVERSDRLRVGLRVLASLPPRMRQVVVRACGDDELTHADVARELGISEQRVRQTLCEARARMRAALADLEKEDQA